MTRFGGKHVRHLFRALSIAALGLGLGTALNPAPARAIPCIGDCDHNGSVTVDEIVTMVNIALGTGDVSSCPAGDADGSGTVTIDELVAAVNAAVAGCSAPLTPTPMPTPTPTPTSPPPTPTATETVPEDTPTASPSPTQIATQTPTLIPSLTPTPPEPTLTPTPSRSPTPMTAGAGLLSTITDVTIDRSGQITATFTLTDANGIPITPLLAAAPSAQQARIRLTVSHVENYSAGGEFESQFSRYVNDINMTRPRYDSGGTLETLDAFAGLYRYTFGMHLPDGFDPTRTYTVGMQVDRTFDGRQLSANPVFDIVPAGGAPQIRQGVATQQCNSCHAPLIAHGNRREVRLCLLCHTEAAVDETGRSVEFRNMLHKIHRGKELPSIVNGAPGATYAIFSSFARQDVVFAQKDADGVITGIGFPRAIESCTVCHSNGATSEFYRQRPATAACASCHDDVNPSLQTTAAGPPGTNHFLNRGFADGACHFCHIADSGKEFDISVVGAHVIPERSRQLAGLNVQIVGLTNHAAGETPTIAFMVTDNAGTPLRDLSGLNRLAFNIAGPTGDYTTAPTTPVAVGGGASGTLTGPDDAGVFQYTPTTALPADASGTWAIGAESRRLVPLTTVDPITAKTATEAAVNPVVTFTVDDSTALVRRVVVEDQKCGACHGTFSKDFSIHGNLRNQTQYCVMCHNPNHSDAARRKRDADAVARGDQTASVDFKRMIHKIHTGEDLEQKPYLIYGFGPAPQNYTIHDFADVRFPGDRRNCETCHASGTYLLPPFPGMALGTRVAHLDPATGNEVEDGRLGPIRSVCTTCHDGEDAAAHAETMTASGGEEACAVCHEEGRAFAVSELHAGRR